MLNPTTGIMTGWEKGKNQNSNKEVILLQVRISDQEDIQTVELMYSPGENVIPVIGSRILIITITSSWKIGIMVRDEIEINLNEGEKEIYSTKNGVVQAFIKFLNTGVLELNGNSDYAVGFNNLESGFNQLKNDFNLHVHPEKNTPPAIGSVASISNAKVEKVRL